MGAVRFGASVLPATAMHGVILGIYAVMLGVMILPANHTYHDTQLSLVFKSRSVWCSDTAAGPQLLRHEVRLRIYVSVGMVPPALRYTCRNT